METIHVVLADRGYPIHIGPGLLRRADLIVPHLAQPRVAVVTNAVLETLYLGTLRSTLDAAGVQVVPIVIPDGETEKNWDTLRAIVDALLSHRCERKTTVMALGGGVVGDLAGFAASVFLRGVPFIQIPTTLLAQVDSSIGGKTGINHPLGKNMIGAFYQPRLVLADIDTLRSLPARELAAGIAEVIKYGLILDRAFFEWLEANMEGLIARDEAALTYAVKRSCELKARVVGVDERESGERALLNLGHTFGHAIEAGLSYGTWLHGEAVAAGTVMAAQLSMRMGKLTARDVDRIVALLVRAQLPVRAPELGVDRYLALMGLDKKVEAGRLRLVLLEQIGRGYVTSEFPQGDLRRVLDVESARG